jgi:hypothetical protein
MPGQGCPWLPVGSARTWLQQQYYSERCRSRPPPRGDVSRESSRISWKMPRSDGPKALPPKGRGTPRSIAPRLPDSCGKPRSTPGARGTRRLQPRVASATSTTTATVEPTSTRRCAEATTPGMGDAMTAGRIGAPRPNHPVRKLSAGPYDGRRSRPSSEPRLPSPSTRGKQDWNCGSRTTGWPAVGAKAKTPPFARCLHRSRWSNRDKTTGRDTLRPTRHRTKTHDEVVPPCDLVQHGGPRVIRPIVTGPAWPLRVTGLICKGIPVIIVCNPALWEYSGDNLGV